MHLLASLTHITYRPTQSLLHGLQAGKNGGDLIATIHRNRTRQITRSNAVKMATDNGQWLNNHLARPPQRTADVDRRNNNHADKHQRRNLIVTLALRTGGFQHMVDLQLPGLKVNVKRIL